MIEYLVSAEALAAELPESPPDPSQLIIATFSLHFASEADFAGYDATELARQVDVTMIDKEGFIRLREQRDEGVCLQYWRLYENSWLFAERLKSLDWWVLVVEGAGLAAVSQETFHYVPGEVQFQPGV